MSDESEFQPLFNELPPAVIVLALGIFGVEVMLWLASHGLLGGGQGFAWRRDLILDYGLPGGFLEFVAWAGVLNEQVSRFASYIFIHHGFIHATMVIVFLLALGKLVGEVFGNIAVLVTFFASAFVGALAFAVVAPFGTPLIGGYPAVYGLIGAFTFILWVRYGHEGENQYRAFSLIAFLLGIQLVFGLIFGSGSDWVAEIAGFFTGFALAPLLAPGGIARLRARLRQR